jgi:cation transport regulator ChaC
MSTLELAPGESAIFGYGSLLWQPSLERTYGRPYVGPSEVGHLPGWRRTWDLLYPNRTFFFKGPSGDRRCPENILYLNIQRGDSLLNGVLYAMTETDIDLFDRRELGYDRVNITGELQGVNVVGGPAYVYVGRPEVLLRSPRGPDFAAIRKTYLEIVDKGLNRLGPDFRSAYDASTDPPPAGNIIEDFLDDSPNR